MDGTIEPMTESIRAAILDANAAFAHQALRVLGMAHRRLDREPDAYQAQELEEPAGLSWARSHEGPAAA